jgi:glycosyltransferase involved in cell wall biosynthesis
VYIKRKENTTKIKNILYVLWYTNFMRIGIDARFWNESGVGRYVRNLVKNLAEIDAKNDYVLFVSPQFDNRIFKDKKNWRVVRTDIRWHSLNEQLRFPNIINKENLDLMHFPYFSVPIFYRRPFIVTIHDLILHHFATGEATTRSQWLYFLKLQAYKFVMQISAQKAKKIITVSYSTKEEIVKHLKISPKKISVTYEGVELKSSAIAIKNMSSFFLHVGNLYPHKNMSIVLDAIKKIKDEEKISINLCIVGKEDHFYFKFKRKVEELGLKNQVRFLGEVTDSELQKLYKNSLAYISPSLMEGFDLPAVEAMNNNCLVLASDIPVHREICRDAAVYFSLENEDDLIVKLKEIYVKGKKEYIEKINKGSALAQKFNWKEMARDTLKIYENSLSLR